MEVRLTPDLERQLNAAAAMAGLPADQLAQDAIAGYLGELADVRATLDTRYDGVKSGKVTLIPGEEVEAYFREKKTATRQT